jgi:sensor histidine kinase YesM
MQLTSIDLSSTALKKPSLRFTIGAVIVLAAVALLLYSIQPGPIFYFTLGWLIVIALLLWVGNRQLTIRLDGVLPWSRYGNWRFFIHLLLGLAYLLLLVNLIYFIIRVSLTDSTPTREQIIVMNAWGAAIFIPVFSLYFSLHFLRHWRESELEVEKVQKEKIRSQLDSLKNHLDPHFLFNNLNILSSLVDKDTAASKIFIEKFAEVYRSLLRTKSDDLIPLQEEMAFIQSYMYLIRVRFENHIVFTNFLGTDSKNKMLPPLTLQMLIENAIKHNLITEKQPLTIELVDGVGHYLIVRNNLHPKLSGQKETSGSGLQNIQQRYSHFTDLPVRIEKTETHFEVHIPLLEIEHA